jgi:hypothetical protein
MVETRGILTQNHPLFADNSQSWITSRYLLETQTNMQFGSLRKTSFGTRARKSDPSQRREEL